MAPSASSTLTHTIALLEQPACGSPAVALLDAGVPLETVPAEHGFALLRLPDGSAGYLPAALLAGQPADLSQPITVMHSATLYRSASTDERFGARPIVARYEEVRTFERAGNFIKIVRTDGQAGFLPQALCWPLPGQPARAQVLQAVALYRSPTAGGQYGGEFQIEPGEPLIELGRSGQFVLAQRHDGQIGFVLAGLCGAPQLDSILPVGPLDLGWLTIGFGWWLVNWGAVSAALVRYGMPDLLRRYAALALLVGIVAALWLLARRRLAARSLAIGALLGHALLYLGAR